MNVFVAHLCRKDGVTSHHFTHSSWCDVGVGLRPAGRTTTDPLPGVSLPLVLLLKPKVSCFGVKVNVAGEKQFSGTTAALGHCRRALQRKFSPSTS